MPGLPAVSPFRHDPPVVPTSSIEVDVDEPAFGPWGCNAAGKCAKPAVIQWAAPSPTDDDPMRTVPAFACADHEGA